MILDGRVITSGFDDSTSIDSTSVHIASVDASTGATLWSRSVKTSQIGSLVTDGRLVLLSHSESTARGAVITAYVLADGRQRWEIPIDAQRWLVVMSREVVPLFGGESG